MDKITHQARVEQWTNIINECLASGMNKTAWCKQNGISDKAFFYWQRIIRKEAFREAALPPPIEMDPKDSALPVFVELQSSTVGSIKSMNEQSFQPDMIIRKGDLIFEISNSVSLELLSHIGVLIHAK